MSVPDLGKRAGWICALLFAAGVALYARTLAFDFVGFDDTTVLLAKPNLYDETSFAASLHQIFVADFPREEPLLLRDVSWALDARLFGFANPLGYHLGNVLLNAANGCLLFLFLAGATRRHGFAATVAALFVVLPVHVEPVSWVMGRKDVLSTFFVLSALLCQHHELAGGPRRRTLYLAGLLCTGLALLSKMGAVTAFLVLGLHRVFHPYLDGRRSPDQPLRLADSARRVLPLAPHALLSVGLFLWFSHILGAYGIIGWRGPAPTDPEHLQNVVRFAPLVVGRYLKLVFWPGELSLYYRWPHVEIPLTAFELVASAAIAVGVLAGTVALCRRRRDLAFYALAFLAFLLPYLNLVYVGIWSADRYVYLSSFCLLALATSGALALARRFGRPGRWAVAALLLAFGVASAAETVRHQGVWRDDEALWSYEAHRSEPSLLSIQALAKLRMKQAAREQDPAVRTALVAEARRLIARGFAREQELGRVAAPYGTSEQLQLSRLHSLLGRLAALDQAPLAEQIEHYERAYAIAPTRANTLWLAGALFDLALRRPSPEREALLRRSLDHFLEHVEYSSNDPVLHRQSLALLRENYEQRFPFLRERIQQARVAAAR